jgi:hypothetical protein
MRPGTGLQLPPDAGPVTATLKVLNVAPGKPSG